MADLDDATLARLTAESGGNPVRGASIARSLTRLAESPDPALRRMAVDILEGRKGVRSVVADPAFDAHLTTAMPTLFAHLDALEPEERERLVREGRRLLDPDAETPPDADQNRR